jgi:hypothetical protein
MRRRTLFGLPIAAFFGLWPRRGVARSAQRYPIRDTSRLQEPPLVPAMPIAGRGTRPAPVGPTMKQLIDLAELDLHDRGMYDRLLTLAIRETGPVTVDLAGGTLIYHRDGVPAAKFGHAVTTLPEASCVAVPESLLPHFLPENRGEEFPRGVSFEPLK